MKYKGIELKEFESEKPVLFDPPRKMLVWDYDDETPTEVDVSLLSRIGITKQLNKCLYTYTAPKSRTRVQN